MKSNGIVSSYKDFAAVSQLVYAGFMLFGTAAFLLSFYEQMQLLEVVLVVFLSIMLPIRTRKNTLLFLLSIIISYSCYSAVAANYFPLYYDWYMAYAGTDISAQGTTILLIYLSVLHLFLPRSIREVQGFRFWDRFSRPKYSLTLTLLVASLLVVIAFTQSSGFSDTGGRAESNQLYEYSYLFFVFGFYFAKENRACRGIMLAVSALYFAQAILGGNRASILAIIMLVYALFFSTKWSVKQIAPFVLLGFLAFQLVGLFREDIGGADLSDLLSGVTELLQKGLVWDTAAAAYHQGLAYIKYLNEIDQIQRLYYLGQWLLGIILGGSAVPDSMLSAVVQDHYMHQVTVGGLGGGFLPEYAYFYFGILGVIVSGAITAWVFSRINCLNHETSTLGSFITLSLFATSCRWFLYSTAPLTRGLLFMVILGGLCLLFFEPSDSSYPQLSEEVPKTAGGYDDAK